LWNLLYNHPLKRTRLNYVEPMFNFIDKMFRDKIKTNIHVLRDEEKVNDLLRLVSEIHGEFEKFLINFNLIKDGITMLYPFLTVYMTLSSFTVLPKWPKEMGIKYKKSSLKKIVEHEWSNLPEESQQIYQWNDDISPPMETLSSSTFLLNDSYKIHEMFMSAHEECVEYINITLTNGKYKSIRQARSTSPVMPDDVDEKEKEYTILVPKKFVNETIESLKRRKRINVLPPLF
jgi:hypothetical protein